MSQYQSLRQQMVEDQLSSRGIKNEKILNAFLNIPRERFVPDMLAPDAYGDRPLSIGYDQTISQPYIVALMTELLELTPQDKVLEIGTGSGYQSAILATLECDVYSVERIKELAEKAKSTLASLDLHIHLNIGDGTGGWKEYAPYNKIIVTAAAKNIPVPLIEQLAIGGILVMPVGEPYQQTLTVLHKTSQDTVKKTSQGGCIFVPLIGHYGHSDE